MWSKKDSWLFMVTPMLCAVTDKKSESCPGRSKDLDMAINQQFKFAGIRFQLMRSMVNPWWDVCQTYWDPCRNMCLREERRGWVDCQQHSRSIKTHVRIWHHQESGYRGRTEDDPALSLVGPQWRGYMEQMWISSISPDSTVPPGSKQTIAMLSQIPRLKTSKPELVWTA